METIERFDVPTVEAVMTIGCDRETAEKVVAILDGTLSPVEASSACAAWVRQCYHKPDIRKHEAKLMACADLLGMHDTCGLDVEDAGHYTDEGIRMCPPFSYANAGDTYVATLARDHARGQWVIASWGDLLEEYERENKIGNHEEFDEAPDACPSCGKRGTFKLESFKRGEWENGQFIENGTGYSFVCGECNHHCQTPEDFEPPTEDEVDECEECGSLGSQACAPDCETQRQGDDEGDGEDDDPEGTECSTCGDVHDDDNHNHQ